MADSTQLRMQYLGVLNLLANISVYIHGTEAPEFRALIQDALEDAQEIIPELRWKRIINRFELDLVPR
jgi:hypothetical protein